MFWHCLSVCASKCACVRILYMHAWAESFSALPLACYDFRVH